MTPEEMDRSIRETIDHVDGLSQEQAQYLLARYDEAVVNQNANATSLMAAAKMCREARHVAGLALAVLKATKHEENSEGIDLFVELLGGKYSWLFTLLGPQK